MPSYRPNVALLLLNSDDRLLICERLKIENAWQFPQGGVDKGEGLLEAFHREVEEEIGLPSDSYEILDSKDGYRYVFPEGMKRKKKRFDGQEQTYYLCRLKEGAPPIDVDRRPREFRGYKWIRPSDFQLSWLPEFKHEVYRQVLRDFFDVTV